MTETELQLIRCFRAVFPELTENEALNAKSSSVAAWDSVATVTLVAAVEEEFGIQFETEEIEEMNSFQSYMDRLKSH